jgi:hypothetical protein
MAEDGHLAELLLTRFLDLNLSQLPTLTHVSSGAEAAAGTTSSSARCRRARSACPSWRARFAPRT